jgi:MSHA pilin protein MshD
MTLIELIIAIVIIGAGLAGVLMAFTTAVKNSADPMIYKQMSAIADGLMEEILLKPFATPGTPVVGCARTAIVNVGAYNGYAAAHVCDIEGTPIAALDAYGVNIGVSAPATSPFPDVPAADVLVVRIEVTHGAGNTYALTGWRTNYAGP